MNSASGLTLAVPPCYFLVSYTLRMPNIKCINYTQIIVVDKWMLVHYGKIHQYPRDFPAHPHFRTSLQVNALGNDRFYTRLSSSM